MSNENRTIYKIRIGGVWRFQVSAAKRALTDAGFQCLSCTSQNLIVDIDDEHLMAKGLDFDGPRDYVINLLDSAAPGPRWRKLLE